VPGGKCDDMGQKLSVKREEVPAQGKPALEAKEETSNDSGNTKGGQSISLHFAAGSNRAQLLEKGRLLA